MNTKNLASHILKIVIASVISSSTLMMSSEVVRATTGPTISDIPNSIELLTAVRSSSTDFRAPALSIPPLSASHSDFLSVNSASGTVIPSSRTGCSVNDNSTSVATDLLTRCTYGDLTSSKLILLIGDSNAWMWIPAFDTFGVINHVKVIALTHNGCSPWSRPWMPQKAIFFAGNFTESMCAVWREQALLRGLSLEPALVVPVGIDLPAPYMAPPNGLKSSMQALIRRIGSARTVFLEPPPHFSSFAAMAGCVSTRATALNVCEVRTKWLAANQISIMQQTLGRDLHVSIVSTKPLFCGSEFCPIFVKLRGKSYLVYGDGYHISLSYSQLVGKALDLKRYLP